MVWGAGLKMNGHSLRGSLNNTFSKIHEAVKITGADHLIAFSNHKPCLQEHLISFYKMPSPADKCPLPLRRARSS